jgi:hypothetical protein
MEFMYRYRLMATIGILETCCGLTGTIKLSCPSAPPGIIPEVMRFSYNHGKPKGPPFMIHGRAL